MDTETLIERLEKATGADRALDALIDARFRIGPVDGPQRLWKNFPTWKANTPSVGRVSAGFHWASISFTGSVDAALSLVERVLPGAEMELTNLYGVAGVTIHSEYGPFYGSNECGSFPLAICLALLRAVQAKGTTDE